MKAAVEINHRTPTLKFRTGVYHGLEIGDTMTVQGFGLCRVVDVTCDTELRFRKLYLVERIWWRFTEKAKYFWAWVNGEF